MHAPNVEVQVKEAKQILAEQAAEHFPGLEVEVHVGPSTEVAKDVARFAEENGFDLIALSTHGRTGFRRMVLGSVAELVLRYAQVPVLCFPRHE
jgi:nucleotide-binding universal stress UspA family protein